MTMMSTRLSRLIVLAMLVCTVELSTLAGQNGEQERGQTSPGQERDQPPAEVEIEVSGVRASIPDLTLVDQYGKNVRLYSELIKNKVVVMSFFFTSCDFICPSQGYALSQLQKALGKRLGKEVLLISISTDPATDTPGALKRWGARFGAKPGWTLLTGSESEMRKLIKTFTGNNAGGRDEHAAELIIGNDKRGHWVSVNGLWPVEELIKVIDQLKK
jgi:protein SCO1/2